jgi:hypothetical protein
MSGFRRIEFIEPWWNCEPGDTARVPNKVAGALFAMKIARPLRDERDDQPVMCPWDTRKGRRHDP